ncbi:hypothetical protein [Flavobacterium flavipallidum]|uniref:Uncharacterized protein n=1 Tax=Flavobacterium flavipallidum TaxID=3139140 RepID=A0ABU9HJT3_9FLAO
MENLEQQEKIINLGKLFVKELKLEPGVDTFSRWMAHYLAEKMSVAEQSEGSQKEAAEKECFDVILKLWQHRHSLPTGRRPFESFESLLETLSKLKPDTDDPYFYNAFRSKDLTRLKIDNTPVEEWMDIAKEIDKTSRIWIEYAFNQASNNAKNEKTKEWIENTIELSDNTETDIINVLLDNNTTFNIDDDFSKQYDIERLTKRISQLQKYAKLNETILNAYKTDLENHQAK